MSEIFVGDYIAEARRALKNPVLQGALADLQNRFGRGTAIAYRNLPEGPDLRLKAHEIRENAIAHLDVLLETLAANIREKGGHVFFARDAEAAVDYCLATARRHQVKVAVKGKSMVSEEIGLNTALIEAGIDVAETDLGEYIIQLAGERPSHIIAPAIQTNSNALPSVKYDKVLFDL